MIEIGVPPKDVDRVVEQAVAWRFTPGGRALIDRWGGRWWAGGRLRAAWGGVVGIGLWRGRGIGWLRGESLRAKVLLSAAGPLGVCARCRRRRSRVERNVRLVVQHLEMEGGIPFGGWLGWGGWGLPRWPHRCPGWRSVFIRSLLGLPLPPAQ